MKALVLSLVLFSSLTVQAQVLPSLCLETAKDWIYKNTPAGSSQAAEEAMRFCSQGGKASCLDGAKDWIYKNTPAGSSQAAKEAIEFCSRGADSACLAPTKDWVYKNTPAGSSEAAKKAIEICRGQVRCEPVSNSRPAPYVGR